MQAARLSHSTGVVGQHDHGHKSTLRLATTLGWWAWLHNEFGKFLLEYGARVHGSNQSYLISPSPLSPFICLQSQRHKQDQRGRTSHGTTVMSKPTLSRWNNKQLRWNWDRDFIRTWFRYVLDSLCGAQRGGKFSHIGFKHGFGVEMKKFLYPAPSASRLCFSCWRHQYRFCSTGSSGMAAQETFVAIPRNSGYGARWWGNFDFDSQTWGPLDKRFPWFITVIAQGNWGFPPGVMNFKYLWAVGTRSVVVPRESSIIWLSSFSR